MHCELHHAHSSMALFRVFCAIRTRLEAVGGSVVRTYLSNYLLRGHSITANMTCKTSKEHHPLFGRHVKVLRPWALFRKTTVYLGKCIRFSLCNCKYRFLLSLCSPNPDCHPHSQHHSSPQCGSLQYLHPQLHCHQLC